LRLPRCGVDDRDCPWRRYEIDGETEQEVPIGVVKG
jgi:hypothetical protein